MRFSGDKLAPELRWDEFTSADRTRSRDDRTERRINRATDNRLAGTTLFIRANRTVSLLKSIHIDRFHYANRRSSQIDH